MGYSPEVQEELRKAIARAARGETVALRRAGARGREPSHRPRFFPAPHAGQDRRGGVLGPLGVRYHRAEADANALRESNEKFHLLADNIIDVFWIRSPDMTEVRYMSPAFERIWGRSAESAFTSPGSVGRLHTAGGPRACIGFFAALKKDTATIDIEYRIVRPDGEIRWIRARGFPVRNAADELTSLTGIVTDITDRKRVEDTLRESEERFSGAFEQAPIGVALVSPDGHWLKVNHAMCDLVAIPRPSSLTLTFQDITPSRGSRERP